MKTQRKNFLLVREEQNFRPPDTRAANERNCLFLTPTSGLVQSLENTATIFSWFFVVAFNWFFEVTPQKRIYNLYQPIQKRLIRIFREKDALTNYWRYCFNKNFFCHIIFLINIFCTFLLLYKSFQLRIYKTKNNQVSKIVTYMI